MTPILAASGAAAVALLEVTLWPFVDVRGVHPHLVFVFAVAWAVAGSLDGAIAWGFTGGLMLDVLAPRPLGATALALLLVVAASAAVGRGFAQVHLRGIAPLVATFPLSVLYSFAVVLVASSADRAVLSTAGLTALLPGAVVDTVISVIVAALVLLVGRRREEQERIGW
ncbi:MAG TPA: rod shape-determining protein MreD [Candidatus Limnocylindrales bacterium]|nr:rod shape-determining protein MreD [Candidatus Limnocylindrales bacterium]